MKEIPFKDSASALEYIEKFFKVGILEEEMSFYGRILSEDTTESPMVYIVQIIIKKKNYFQLVMKK